MCGRYSLFAEEDEEIREIVRQVQERSEIKTGEIFPTNPAPVLVAQEDRIVPRAMSWGFLQYGKKGVIINARAETAAEKRSFAPALETGRCVVPSTGFYEWDAQKQKQRFSLPGSSALYMGGLWRPFSGEAKFVILTTAANPSVAAIHGRMPLVLTKEQLNVWLLDANRSMELLHQTPPSLTHERA